MHVNRFHVPSVIIHSELLMVPTISCALRVNVWLFTLLGCAHIKVNNVVFYVFVAQVPRQTYLFHQVDRVFSKELGQVIFKR